MAPPAWDSCYPTWSGLAFESAYLKHTQNIKKVLGIAGIHTREFSWESPAGKFPNQPGAQIDLVIDRADGCMNICEINNAKGAFEITKAYARDLDRKAEVFTNATSTPKILIFDTVNYSLGSYCVNAFFSVCDF